MAETALVWFRNDLRIADNPALSAAFASGAPVTALFVHETDPALRPIGGAARWWLHHSLGSLATSLAQLGVELHVATGRSGEVVQQMAKTFAASAVFWNRRYPAADRAHDSEIKQTLRAEGHQAHSFNGSLLVEPWEIETGQGKPYSVFTPFWKALKTRQFPAPLQPPTGNRSVSYSQNPDSNYTEPHWSASLARHWRIGEAAAQSALERFLDERLARYKEGRDFPGLAVSSELSPHLRFGEISPRQIWHAALWREQQGATDTASSEKFLSELAWREFSYHLLYHREDIAQVPMQAKYAAMPWREDSKALRAWQRGQTGFPIVDAGMRQLWQTGWVHNRVRMLVASLLAKNLLIDWRLGEQWFWDTLVDADPASNPASWQWVAGCGADAAPYFRIFNPVTQGERFDGAGGYVRTWVPELAALPDQWIQKPFEAPDTVLIKAGVRLGDTYPHPIVDLLATRHRALAALSETSAED